MTVNANTPCRFTRGLDHGCKSFEFTNIARSMRSRTLVAIFASSRKCITDVTIRLTVHAHRIAPRLSLKLNQFAPFVVQFFQVVLTTSIQEYNGSAHSGMARPDRELFPQ